MKKLVGQFILICLAMVLLLSIFQVQQINGNRILIGRNNVATGWINHSDLTIV